MASGSATRWFRAWHSFPERELLPFRPLLQQRRLDGKPPVQGLLERDSLSGSRSSVLCSDVGLSPPLCRTLPRPDRACGGGRRGRHGAPVAQRRRARRRPVQSDLLPRGVGKRAPDARRTSRERRAPAGRSRGSHRGTPPQSSAAAAPRRPPPPWRPARRRGEWRLGPDAAGTASRGSRARPRSGRAGARRVAAGALAQGHPSGRPRRATVSWAAASARHTGRPPTGWGG